MFDFLLTVSSFVAGIALVAAIEYKSNDFQSGSGDKIVACEKTLTRDQHCMLVAVPEKGE